MQSACEGMLGTKTCSRGENLSQATDTFPTQKSTSHIFEIPPRISWKCPAQSAKEAAEDFIHCEKVLLQLTEKLGVLIPFQSRDKGAYSSHSTCTARAARHGTQREPAVPHPELHLGKAGPGHQEPPPAALADLGFGNYVLPAPTHPPALECLQQEELDLLTIYILMMFSAEQTLTRNA